MNIITGYKGEAHITAQQDRNINSGIFGSGVYILNIGSKLAATVISANEIQIADGLIVAEGCAAEIESGTSESLAIANGTQDMLRKDLIVLRYTKNSGTGVEDMSLVVITGTPAASSPALPSYTSGFIAEGDTTVDFPLYTVNIDGITIDSVDCMVSTASLAQTSAVTSLQSTVNTLNTKVGSTAMGTTATTITGAIKELLTSITSLASSLTSALGKITSLETKTQGFEGTRQYTVAASGGKTYVHLYSLSSYMIIVNAYSASDALRGMYLIGVNSGSAIGISTVKNAGSVVLDDVSGGILRITNNGSVTLRVTVITTSGSIPG